MRSNRVMNNGTKGESIKVMEGGIVLCQSGQHQETILDFKGTIPVSVLCFNPSGELKEDLLCDQQQPKISIPSGTSTVVLQGLSPNLNDLKAIGWQSDTLLMKINHYTFLSIPVCSIFVCNNLPYFY